MRLTDVRAKKNNRKLYTIRALDVHLKVVGFDADGTVRKVCYVCEGTRDACYTCRGLGVIWHAPRGFTYYVPRSEIARAELAYSKAGGT